MNANNVQYGKGLEYLLKVGMAISAIIAEIKELNMPISNSLLLHSLYESTQIKDGDFIDKAINSNSKMLVEQLKPRLESINKSISTINKVLSGLDFKNKVPHLKLSDITKITNQRLRTIYDKEEVQKLSDEYFSTLLNRTLKQPIDACFKLLDDIKFEQYKDDLKVISEFYREGIVQSLNVCSIGYYSTAVFIAGKTVEELINDYMDKLVLLRKLEKINIKDTKLEIKIGKLKRANFIDDEIYHKLSSIKIDRNEFGHPSKKLLSKKQAHLRIRTIIEVIHLIEKKINRLPNKNK